MLLGLDHIVIAVRDLAAAARDYEALGFTVVPGGKHPVGTHNALISFGDGAYIELIAFYQANPDHRWWNALQKGEGLVDYCMRTDDLAGDTRKFREAGVHIDDPVPWSRTRPDGYQLKWLLSLAREGHRGVAPFLIQDVTPREERVPQKFDHKNGAVGIATVTVAVEDFPTVHRWYRSVLDYDGDLIERNDLQATGLRFQIGRHLFDFIHPARDRSPLVEWLKASGPSPYAATLRSNKQKASELNSTLTHGAALSFE